ncbi:hypothetical protein AB5I41_07790 [Sphingomonas sp. MMS24-JH45]
MLTFVGGGSVRLSDSVYLTNAAGKLVGSFATIQAAIDAAGDNATITLSGSYAEKIVVNKAGLTIEGAGATLTGTFRSDNAIAEGTTVAKFTETATGYNDTAGAGVTVNAANVTIKGLAITSYLTGVAVGSANGL